MKRGIALILGICLIIGCINFYVFDVWDRISETYNISQRDRALAEDLSSMTGKTADSLMQLKSKSGSWNDVINNLGNEEIQEKLSDEQLQNLIETESFSASEISEAKMLMDQISFNLGEILRNESSFEIAMTTDIAFRNDNKTDNKTEIYRKIGQSFDKNLAIYFALKLQDKFGSLQMVIDEYLYCLQIDVDLSLLITDTETYEKAVLEKGAQLMREEAITVDDISTRMLETLQPKKADFSSNADSELPTANTGSTAVSPVNIVPKDPQPQDPAKEIMDEIDKINQIWMSGR